MELFRAAERLGGYELELVGGTQPLLVGFKRQGDRGVHQGADAPAEHGSVDECLSSAVRNDEPRNNNWTEPFTEIVEQSKYCKSRGSDAWSGRVREARAHDGPVCVANSPSTTATGARFAKLASALLVVRITTSGGTESSSAIDMCQAAAGLRHEYSLCPTSPPINWPPKPPIAKQVSTIALRSRLRPRSA